MCNMVREGISRAPLPGWRESRRSWAQQGGRYISSRVLGSERGRRTEAGSATLLMAELELWILLHLSFFGKGPRGSTIQGGCLPIGPPVPLPVCSLMLQGHWDSTDGQAGISPGLS